MTIQHLKPPAALIICLTATLLFAALLFTRYIRLRTIDPHVTTEFSNRVTANRVAARQPVIPTMIDGEVARTADRIGEATALALAASLYAASVQTRGRTPRNVQNLLAGMAAQHILPPDLTITQVEGTLISPSGKLSVRYRPAPLAVEIISIGNKPETGPALIVRVPNELSDKGEAQLFIATSLGEIRVPAPFVPAAEIIALGWSPERWRSFK